MCPEYGATAAYFPVDEQTLALPAVHRPRRRRRPGRALHEGAGAVPRRDGDPEPVFSEVARAGPRGVSRRGGTEAAAGPRAAAGRVAVVRRGVPRARRARPEGRGDRRVHGRGRHGAAGPARPVETTCPRRWSETDGIDASRDGSVVIAAITSCTNTSNPSVMLAAGLLAKKAVEAGPAVQAVGEDVARPGLARGDRLPRPGRAHALPRQARASRSSGTAARPASGTPGRCPRRWPTPWTRATSPWSRCCRATATSRAASTRRSGRPTSRRRRSCVAYALAGRVDVDLTTEPLGDGGRTGPVYLRDLWPTRRGGPRGRRRARSPPSSSSDEYGRIFDGDDRWRALDVPTRPCTPGMRRRPTCGSRRSSRSSRDPRPLRRHRGRPRAGEGRRLDHHRSHLAGRLDQAGLTGRAVPARARRRAARLQLVRRRGAGTTR